MRYLRENSRVISRLLINQVGMTIFGLILTMAVMMAAKNNGTVVMLVSVFSVIFYLCLIYNVMWEEGARNIIRIKAGRMEKSAAFPFKAALWASVPNLVLAGLMAISGLLAYTFGISFFEGVQDALHIIVGAIQAMYLGLFNQILLLFPSAFKDLVATVLYILSPLPMILVAAGGYFLGTRNIYLLGKPKPKNKKKPKNED